MFYACIFLFSYMGTNLSQIAAAAVLRLRPQLRLKIPVAIRGTVFTQIVVWNVPRSAAGISSRSRSRNSRSRRHLTQIGTHIEK